MYALLAPDPSRFRERAVLSFARFDLRRLQRTAGGRTQSLTTDDGGTWRAPSGADADAAHLALVVGALSDLRAEQFVTAPPPGEPTARLEVDIKPPGEPRPIHHVVQVWARTARRLRGAPGRRRDLQTGRRDVRGASPRPAGD